MISGGVDKWVTKPTSNTYDQMCEKGRFDRWFDDNKPLAKRCAEEKTENTGRLHIDVLAERYWILSADYRVEEAGPIAKMYHVLDGLAARQDPRVKVDVVNTVSGGESIRRVFYSVDVVVEKERCQGIGQTGLGLCQVDEIPAPLQFQYYPERTGYDQYQAVLKREVGTVARWTSDQLFCFASSKWESEIAAVGALQVFKVCPKIEVPEAVLKASWEKQIAWVLYREEP